MVNILIFVVFCLSMYVVGLIAASRERRVKPWIWAASAIGPLAIPFVYLFPRKRPPEN